MGRKMLHLPKPNLLTAPSAGFQGTLDHSEWMGMTLCWFKGAPQDGEATFPGTGMQRCLGLP